METSDLTAGGNIADDDVAGEPLRGCTLGRGIRGTGARVRMLRSNPQLGTATPRTRQNNAYAIQPLYVLPLDGTDNGLATDGTTNSSVAAMQHWFAKQSGGSRLRFLTGSVATVRVGETDAQIASTGWFVRDRVEELLRDEGYDDPYRVYAVWYEGTSTKTCGGGAWPPELIGHVAALYLRARYTINGRQVDCSLNRYSSDGMTPGFNDFSMLHELLHTLGVAPDRALHHTQRGHVSDDPTDLMYAGDAPWRPAVLDVGHDDYYLTGRTDSLDLSRSVFLDPQPPEATPPPGWP
jgi:hypothetical protein